MFPVGSLVSNWKQISPLTVSELLFIEHLSPIMWIPSDGSVASPPFTSSVVMLMWSLQLSLQHPTPPTPPRPPLSGRPRDSGQEISRLLGVLSWTTTRGGWEEWEAWCGVALSHHVGFHTSISLIYQSGLRSEPPAEGWRCVCVCVIQYLNNKVARDNTLALYEKVAVLFGYGSLTPYFTFFYIVVFLFFFFLAACDEEVTPEPSKKLHIARFSSIWTHSYSFTDCTIQASLVRDGERLSSSDLLRTAASWGILARSCSPETFLQITPQTFYGIHRGGGREREGEMPLVSPPNFSLPPLTSLP